MLKLLFTILLICVFVPMGVLAIKTSWSLIKVLLFLLFLPTIIIVCFIKGLFLISYPLLVLAFAIYVISKLVNRNAD